MSTSVVTSFRIDRQTIRDTRAKVFRRRESTMTEEAARYAMRDYEATLVDIRRQMRAVLETLPDWAFEDQPAPSGEDSVPWRAGQVIGHVYDTQANTFLRPARVLAGLPEGPVAPRLENGEPYATLDRQQSLATLDDADRDLMEVLGLIGTGENVSGVYEDERVGRVRLRDLLLFLTIHDDDHLGQLEDLANEGVERMH